jgi:hypothetical protein
MTHKQKAYKKELIKQLHVSERYRGYYKEEDEEYRALLEKHFGERSSKELNIPQLLVLVKYFNYDIPDLPIIKDRSKEVTEAQISLIFGLWSTYANDVGDKALRAFVKRITGNTYLHVDKLSKSDATKVIVALKNTLKER